MWLSYREITRSKDAVVGDVLISFRRQGYYAPFLRTRTM